MLLCLQTRQQGLLLKKKPRKLLYNCPSVSNKNIRKKITDGFLQVFKEAIYTRERPDIMSPGCVRAESQLSFFFFYLLVLTNFPHPQDHRNKICVFCFKMNQPFGVTVCAVPERGVPFTLSEIKPYDSHTYSIFLWWFILIVSQVEINVYSWWSHQLVFA